MLLTALARSAENFKAFTSIRSCTNYRLFSSPFSPSVCLPLHHLYSRRPNGERREETLRRPCGACFLPADTEEAITARRGQIGWGSYLGRIMFDILHHYQLPPSPPQESYLSLADVPLSVMNFLCPPPLSLSLSSGPPYLSTLHLLQQRKREKREVVRGGSRGEEIKKKKGGD